MLLTPTEMERLTIFTAAEMARRRRAKGLALNHPEAVAFIVDGRRAKTTFTIGSVVQTRRCQLVIYGQGTKLDDQVEFGVDRVRVYILRERDAPRKKGF